MATGRVAFSHVGFDGRAAEISKSIPYRTFAENVAMNYGLRTPGATAVSGWLQSPGYRRNIEGSFDLTGIGIVRSEDGTYFFTQLFMIPSATTAAPSPNPGTSSLNRGATAPGRGRCRPLPLRPARLGSL